MHTGIISDGKACTMEDYKNENWFLLYQAALVEPDHAKMAGRIKAAEESSLARKEQLRALPGLHSEELHGIADALHTLAVLEKENPETDTPQREGRQPYRGREKGSTKVFAESVKGDRPEDDNPEPE